MTDQGRLKEIIAVVNSQKESVRKLSYNDLNWLIQQAERVAILEQRNKRISDTALKQIDVTQARNERLEKRVVELEELIKSHAPEGRNYTNTQYVELLQENQRYKQALEFYANGKHYGMAKVQGGFYVERVVDRGEKAEESLKGDTNG